MTSASGTRLSRFYEHGGPDEFQLIPKPLNEPGHGGVRVRVEAMGPQRSPPAILIKKTLFNPRMQVFKGRRGELQANGRMSPSRYLAISFPRRDGARSINFFGHDPGRAR